MKHEQSPRITILGNEQTARADPRFVREVVRRTETPQTYFVGDAYRYRDAVTVDTRLIRRNLLASGFSEQDATSFAVIFRTPERSARDMQVEGWYTDNPCIDMLRKKPRSHNFGVSIMLGVNDDEVSHTFWHEVGHAHKIRVEKDSNESIYKGVYLDFVAINTALLTEAMGPFKRRRLQAEQRRILEKLRLQWQQDPAEQYCEAYAHQRSGIIPIYLDSTRIADEIPDGLDPLLLADPELKNITQVFSYEEAS